MKDTFAGTIKSSFKIEINGTGSTISLMRIIILVHFTRSQKRKKKRDVDPYKERISIDYAKDGNVKWA